MDEEINHQLTSVNLCHSSQDLTDCCLSDVTDNDDTAASAATDRTSLAVDNITQARSQVFSWGFCPSFPFPSPPSLRSRAPEIQLGGLGSAVNSTSNLVHFGRKI